MSYYDFDPYTTSHYYDKDAYFRCIDKIQAKTSSQIVIYRDGKLEVQNATLTKIRDFAAGLFGMVSHGDEARVTYQILKFLHHGAHHGYFAYRDPARQTVSYLDTLKTASIVKDQRNADLITAALEKIPTDTFCTGLLEDVVNYYDLNTPSLAPSFWALLYKGCMSGADQAPTRFSNVVVPPIAPVGAVPRTKLEDTLSKYEQDFARPVQNGGTDSYDTYVGLCVKAHEDHYRALQHEKLQSRIRVSADRIREEMLDTFGFDDASPVRVRDDDAILEEIKMELLPLIPRFFPRSEIATIIEESEKLIQLFHKSFPHSPRNSQQIFHFVRDSARMMAFLAYKGRTNINDREYGLFYLTNSLGYIDQILDKEKGVKPLDRLIAHISLIYRDIGCAYVGNSDISIEQAPFWSADYINHFKSYFDHYLTNTPYSNQKTASDYIASSIITTDYLNSYAGIVTATSKVAANHALHPFWANRDHLTNLVWMQRDQSKTIDEWTRKFVETESIDDVALRFGRCEEIGKQFKEACLKQLSYEQTPKRILPQFTTKLDDISRGKDNLIEITYLLSPESRELAQLLGDQVAFAGINQLLAKNGLGSEKVTLAQFANNPEYSFANGNYRFKFRLTNDVTYPGLKHALIAKYPFQA